MKYADFEMQKVLAEFGKLPEHQVKFIWDMAYGQGHKEGRSGAFNEIHQRDQREAKVRAQKAEDDPA